MDGSGNVTGPPQHVEESHMTPSAALGLWMCICALFSGVTTGTCAFGAPLSFVLLLTLVHALGGAGISDDMRELVATAPLVCCPGQLITAWVWRRDVLRRLPLVGVMLPVGACGLFVGTLLLHSLPRAAARPAVGCLFMLLALQQLTADVRRAVRTRARTGSGPVPQPQTAVDEDASELVAGADEEMPEDPAAAEEQPAAEDECEPAPAEGRAHCRERFRVAVHAAVPAHKMRTDTLFVGRLWGAALGSGTLFGIVAAPGPPLAMFFAHAGVTVNEARVLTCPLVICLYFMSVSYTFSHGVLHPDLALLYALAMLAQAAGFGFGSQVLSKRVSVVWYRRMLFVLLVVSGLNLAGSFQAQPSGGAPWYKRYVPPVALGVALLWSLAAALVLVNAAVWRRRRRRAVTGGEEMEALPEAASPAPHPQVVPPHKP